MEGIMRPETVPEFCFTRSNSDASSLTSENLNDNLDQSADVILEGCTAWTNEKHNRYLDYLEASFVRQLHSTMDSLAWCTDQNEREGNTPQNLPLNLHNTSEEITSLPDEKYRKIINFGEDQPHPYTIAETESLDVNKGPYEHKCRHAVTDSFSTDLEDHPRFHGQDKHLKRMQCKTHTPSTLEESYLSKFCCHNSDGSVIEGTDQNFVDEGCQKRTYGASGAKKLKMAALEDTPYSDQMPFVELY